MTLDPILSAPFAIQFHVVSAICAVVLGPIALLRRSRDIWHRTAGYMWVLAMAATAGSSFWISDSPVIWKFSPIHGLSVLTFWGLWQGIRAARMGQIVRHRKEMQGLYFWAMGVAGMFTFLPGRRMNSVFFDGQEMVGFVAVAVILGSGLAWYGWTRDSQFN